MATDDHSSPEILTLKEAATFLRVSERTLWELQKSGRVPSFFVGSQIRFSLGVLREWCRQQRREGSDIVSPHTVFCCDVCGRPTGTSVIAPGLCPNCWAERNPSDSNCEMPPDSDES